MSKKHKDKGDVGKAADELLAEQEAARQKQLEEWAKEAEERLREKYLMLSDPNSEVKVELREAYEELKAQIIILEAFYTQLGVGSFHILKGFRWQKVGDKTGFYCGVTPILECSKSAWCVLVMQAHHIIACACSLFDHELREAQRAIKIGREFVAAMHQFNNETNGETK